MIVWDIVRAIVLEEFKTEYLIFILNKFTIY